MVFLKRLARAELRRLPGRFILLVGVFHLTTLSVGCGAGSAGSAGGGTFVDPAASMRAACTEQAPIVSEDFSNGGECGFDQEAWDLIGTDTKFDSEFYGAQTGQPEFIPVGELNGIAPPPQGQCVANYFLQRGSDERTPLRLTRYEEFDEVFYCWYEYFKSPFPLGGQKLSRLGSSSGESSSVFLEYSYFDGAPAVTFFLHDSNSSESRGTTTVPVSLSSLEDRWSEWCVYARQGAPGVPEGRIALWLNGTLIANAEEIITRSLFQEWDYLWIGGNSSWSAGFGVDGSTTVPFDGNRYIAGIEIYNSLCQ